MTRYDWYPMIRGRLVAINGRAVDTEAFTDTRAQRLLDREFNLSHSAALPGHNTVEAGRWVPDEPNGLSVESGLAETLGLKLGAIAVGGFAAAVAVFALLSWFALALLRRAVPEARAPRWLVLATRQLAARPAFAVLQVSALAVGLLALVLLALLRTDLIGSWRNATPKDAPNRFVINV